MIFLMILFPNDGFIFTLIDRFIELFLSVYVSDFLSNFPDCEHVPAVLVNLESQLISISSGRHFSKASLL